MVMRVNIIPPARTGLNLKRYEFDKLKDKEYGENIFIPAKTKREIHAIRDAAYKYATYNKIKLCTRTVDGGVNVYKAD